MIQGLLKLKNIKKVNLNDNKVDDKFVSWLPMYIYNQRVQFGRHSLIKIQLADNGVTSELQDLLNQLSENHKIQQSN
jgi:hypothetical protein